MDYCSVNGCTRHTYDEEQFCGHCAEIALELMNFREERRKAQPPKDCDATWNQGDPTPCSRRELCECYVAGHKAGGNLECDRWMQWLSVRLGAVRR